MAYYIEKKGYYYLYAKDPSTKKYRCMKPLGQITETEAKNEVTLWEADNIRGKGPVNSKDRTMESIWREYMEWMISHRRSPETIKGAESYVYPFIKSMKHLSELTSQAIKEWDIVLRNWQCQNTKITKLICDDTRAVRLRTIRAFCGWLANEEQGYLSETPFKIKIPAQRKDAGRSLSGDEVKRLFDCWPGGELRAKQEFANLAKLFYLIKFYAGTRSKELLGHFDEHTNTEHLGITYECLNRKDSFFVLGKTKSGKPREIGLDRTVMAQIPEGKGSIFYGKISKTCLVRYLRRACQAAGIEGRFRPHDSRVTAASDWGRRGENAKKIMDQFGWKTESMAIHYTKVATSERVESAQHMYK